MLVVVSLLVGGLLVPLAKQTELRRVRDTEQALNEIKQALVGFALINGRLPCPDYDADPSATGYGEEDSPCPSAPTTEGFLPWKTLGVDPLDAWGIKRTQTSDPRIGEWRYRVDHNYVVATTFKSSAFETGGSAFANDLRVRDKSGGELTVSNERAIAIVYSGGKDLQPNQANATPPLDAIYTTDVIDDLDPSDPDHFDDVVIWLTRPVLVSKLVAAGKLP